MVDLLRVSTAGSVDDGKSTLIGRLLHDTDSILDDQRRAVEHATRRLGRDGFDLSLLTDGLRAEREQSITIDVAYRYFATTRRKFIIADTPGHVQYTRNMVTGASTADLAMVLVDARHGVVTQSRRHGFIAALLGIPHLVVAVNKMDLVDWDAAAFHTIADEYARFAERVGLAAPVCVPIAALHGDNVVTASTRMPWYDGPTLLAHLETVPTEAPDALDGLRFPVQYVIRPHQDFRGLAGRIDAGTVKLGDAVVALPSGRTARVRSIHAGDRPVDAARAGDSIVLTLDTEIDASRGDLLAAADERTPPTVATRIDATLCWLGDAPSTTSRPYIVRHTTRTTRALVRHVAHRIDVDTLAHVPTTSLALNEIGRVTLESTTPLVVDPYASSRSTGSFILIDPDTHATVAAGMIAGAQSDDTPTPVGTDVSPDVHWESWNVSRAEREQRNGHAAAVVWLTGLSGAGKSTLARAVERRLFDGGCLTMLLDGDQLRHGLNGDLGFGAAARAENVRRAGEVARLFFEAGHVVLCAFVSPFHADRQRVREALPNGRFLEVHVDCALDTCRARDPKGLYARATSGALTGLTGVDSPYEPPAAPELHVDTDTLDIDASVALVLDTLRAHGIAPPR